jgi:flagellar biosynthesis repressor protein FlbT
MSKPMLISLRPGERVYINGAVVQVDRKVTIELLNDAMFLLEGHVMHYSSTSSTPPSNPSIARRSSAA